MAAGDQKQPGESKDELPARKPDAPARSHEDMGVRVTRDLNATGPVARGYGAKMSKMNFSSRGMPRDEVVDDEDPAPAKPVAAAPVQSPAPAAPSAAPTAAPDDAESGGTLSWLTGLFKRR